MMQVGRCLRCAPETRQPLLRIRVIGKDAFECNDAARVPLPRAINHAHPAAPDLFQNLIIAQPPVGVAHVDFTKYILQRFSVLALAVLTCLRRRLLRQALRKQTTQSKSPFDARSRSALRTGDWFLLLMP